MILVVRVTHSDISEITSSVFRQLGAAGTMYDCLAVAVPPRIPTPLNRRLQLRVAVKDCFFLKGLKNSLCNRAYYDFSDYAPFTAKVVQTLARDGAHILGFTKLSSMIAREEPTDAVDFKTAFNPRGDGYQSPAGSSSGSAVSVAAYPWVDCAIGTDTSGSGRRPALVNGVWQFRPSHELVDLDGIVKTYPAFDTPCVFARDLAIIKHVLEAWVPNTTPTGAAGPEKQQFEIIYPVDYFPVANEDQQDLIEKFVDDVRCFLGATVTKLSIRESWKTSHPPDTPDNIDTFLNDVVTRTYYYQFYHSSDTFRQTYAKAYDGRPPYVIPFVRRRWARGSSVSSDDHREATARMNIYKVWLHDLLFSSRKSTALVVLPISTIEPNYRDTTSPSPEEQSALDELFLPPILGAPDIAVPIGEVTYDSRISNQEEYLPVVVDVVGAPGSDLRLLGAVETVMMRSKRPTIVETGARMFPPQKTWLVELDERYPVA